MRGSRKWVAIAIAIAAGSLTLWPAGAGAASIDTASDHAALVAYDSYVEGLLSSLPAAHVAVADYVSSISARCPDVLAPIAALPAGSVNGGALLAVGEEIGADLAAASYPALRAPFARFAATLVHLRWSSSQTGRTMRGFVTALRRVFALRPSHLCSDLRASVASVGQTTPPGTLHYLARFARVQSVQESRLNAFIAATNQFLSPSDAGLLDDINRASKRYAGSAKALLNPQATRLLTALGLAS
jgi:hypothetical protein